MSSDRQSSQKYASRITVNPKDRKPLVATETLNESALCHKRRFAEKHTQAKVDDVGIARMAMHTYGSC